ncbi:MAG: hypothetical protein ABI444_07885 [Candidatus Kapaibacterium sp.]
MNFGSGVSCVYFVDLPGGPSLGFVGLWSGEVWRTTDAGNSWTLTTGSPALNSYVTGITFKDKMTGWFSSGFFSGFYPGTLGRIYKTVDGGLNWKAVTPAGTWSSVYYNPGKQLLLASDWNGSGASYSTDEGSTWNISVTGRRLSGYSFSDADHGIVSMLGGSFMTTSDGGFTWTPANFSVECWYPLMVPGTKECYAVSEASGGVFHSSDWGNNWTKVTSFMTTATAGPTGYVQLENDGVLSIQSRDRGVLISSDQGQSWNSISGPNNQYDTRFFGKCNYVFAGLGASITEGALLRYVFNDITSVPRPQAGFMDTSGAMKINVHTSDSVTTTIRSTNTISNSPSLDNLDFTVLHDPDMISITGIRAATGFSLVSQSDNNGVTQFRLKRQSTVNIPAGTALVDIRSIVELTPSHVSKLILENILYSDSASVTVCGILPSFTADTMTIVLHDQCGDSTLRSQMNKTLELVVLGIYPNPIHGNTNSAAFAQVELSLANAGHVRLQLTDAIGRIVGNSADFDLSAGQHTLPLRTDQFGKMQLAEGVYYLNIRSGSVSLLEKLAVVHEH